MRTQATARLEKGNQQRVVSFFETNARGFNVLQTRQQNGKVKVLSEDRYLPHEQATATERFNEVASKLLMQGYQLVE